MIIEQETGYVMRNASPVKRIFYCVWYSCVSFRLSITLHIFSVVQG